MTRRQKQLIRDTFDSVREVAGPLALLFYGKLFELEPAARALFHNDLRIQGRKLMDMLSAIVDALDSFESFRPKLVELGRRHVGYGVRPEHYDTLAIALEWSLAQAAQSAFDQETRAAWRALIDEVSVAMKSVYEETPSAVL